jgi:hypothetical protein
MTTRKAWSSSSYLYFMGLPEKSAGAAGSGSNKLSLTTERKGWSYSTFILWGYLRKATARQVVTHMNQV